MTMPFSPWTAVSARSEWSIMKRACIILPIICFAFVWTAGADSLRSVVVSTTQTLHIGSDRSIRVINFVQDTASNPRSTLKVTKDSNSVVVMYASLSSERTSASDKDLIITGPADVLITNNAGANTSTYLSFKIGND